MAPLPHIVETELLKKLVTTPEPVLTMMESSGALEALGSEPLRDLFLDAKECGAPDAVSALEHLAADPRTDERWLAEVQARLMREDDSIHELDALVNRLLELYRKRRVESLRARLATTVDESEQRALLEEVRRVLAGET